MNLKTMIARVLRAMPQVTPGAYGENNIIDMLNEGQQSLLPYVNKTKEITVDVDAETNEIPIPEDLASIANVLWGPTKKELEAAGNKLPKHDLSDETQYGTPIKFYFRDTLIIYPAAKEDNIVTINYIPKPVDMVNDSDAPEHPGSGEYLISYALARLHLEAGSEVSQTWERQKMINLMDFLNVYDQNYAAPFQITRLW